MIVKNGEIFGNLGGRIEKIMLQSKFLTILSSNF